MSNKRVWIDVTDFLKWRGNFTGFQHIQYNMAKEYIASGREVSFFVYDEPAHTFKEVDFDPDNIAADGIINPETITPAPSRKLLDTMKRYVPVRLKRVVKKVIKSDAVKSSGMPTPISPHSPFTSNDVVVVLGGIWHGSFAEDMTHEKQKKGFKFVHIVHDMIPVMCPQYVVEDLPDVFASYKDKIFKIADGLIVNSESSKRDAAAFMKERGITIPKNVVFRLADQPIEENEEKAIPELEGSDFILSMGTIEGRKNHALLYYAYKQAKREGIKLPKLVIAGRKGWLIDDIFYVMNRDPEMKDSVVILNNVANSERAWLYRNCLFTVWPSFYEGWGMPIAESLTYGKLCISSDASAMPEIAPRLLDYFSPFSSDECLRLMVKYLDPKVRTQKEKQIKANYKITTWHDMFVVISGFIDKV